MEGDSFIDFITENGLASEFLTNPREVLAQYQEQVGEEDEDASNTQKRRLELMGLNPNYLNGSSLVGGKRGLGSKKYYRTRGSALVGGCENQYGAAFVGGSEANYNNTWQQYLVDFRNACGADISGKSAYIVSKMAAPGYPAWLEQQGYTEALRKYNERQEKNKAHYCATGRGLMYTPGGRLSAQQAYKYPKLVPHPNYVCPLPGVRLSPPSDAAIAALVKAADTVAKQAQASAAVPPISPLAEALREQGIGEGYYRRRR
jgi:hypothetical protein